MATLYQQKNEFLEENYLLALLRSEWQNAEALSKNGSFDTQKFQRLVKSSGSGGYIDWLIESAHKEALFSGELLSLFKNIRKKAKVDNSYILGMLDKVLEAASKRNVDLILLKGADLAHRIYESQELRLLDDVDLLIRYSDLDQFMGILSTLDFKVPSARGLQYFKKASYTVECWTKSLFPCLFEVHWDLSQRFRYKINMDEIWKTAETYPPFSHNAKFLKLEHLFLHLCLHLFHHSFHPQLKWHVDLKEIIKKVKINMNFILDKSSEWGCRYSVFYALLYLKKLFPDILNQSIFDKFELPPFRDYIISKYYSENPMRLFDSGGKKIAERAVRTLVIDDLRNILLFAMNRLFRNPWVKFEED